MNSGRLTIRRTNPSNRVETLEVCSGVATRSSAVDILGTLASDLVPAEALTAI